LTNLWLFFSPLVYRFKNTIIVSVVFQVPPEFDIDSEQLSDSTHTAEYAKDIFDYLKSREVGLVVFINDFTSRGTGNCKLKLLISFICRKSLSCMITWLINQL